MRVAAQKGGRRPHRVGSIDAALPGCRWPGIRPPGQSEDLNLAVLLLSLILFGLVWGRVIHHKCYILIPAHSSSSSDLRLAIANRRSQKHFKQRDSPLCLVGLSDSLREIFSFLCTTCHGIIVDSLSCVSEYTRWKVLEKVTPHNSQATQKKKQSILCISV